MTRMSRRQLLGLGGAGAAVAVPWAIAAPRGPPPPPSPVPFYGEHQAGVTTAVQDRLHFAAFDLTTGRRAELVGLLRAWTEAAARMCAGRDAGAGGAVGGAPEAPPDDTGEALGLPPARLTVTFGFGPTLFELDGRGRFGLAARRPPALAELPAFPGDALEPERSGGDLAVQACADDPQVAVHAVRNLARIAHGTAAVRWSQLGFGRTSTTSRAQDTPRNLFGFKDGTANLRTEDTADLQRQVWVQPGDGPAWMNGGTYLVARRIRMHVEVWDRTSLAEQEATIGRAKGSGAPLGAERELDPLDLAATGVGGAPLVPRRRARAARPPIRQRRRAAAAPRLLVRGRLRRPRPPGRRAVLHRLPARPAPPVRADPAPAGRRRRDGRVRQAHRQRPVRLPAGRPPRRLRGRGAVRLRGPAHSPGGGRAGASGLFGERQSLPVRAQAAADELEEVGLPLERSAAPRGDVFDDAA